MTLQDVFGEALLKQVGPVARDQGFKRARRVWRRSNQHGDWAAFDVQSSRWDSADRIECIVNLGAAPAPWLDYRADRDGRAFGTFGTSDGIFRSRIAPDSTRDQRARWWRIASESDAESVAAEIADRMVQDGFRLLAELLDRERMKARIRDGRMGFIRDPDPRWLSIVLADEGPSSDLDDALDRAGADVDDAEAFELRAWCQRRTPSRSR